MKSPKAHGTSLQNSASAVTFACIHMPPTYVCRLPPWDGRGTKSHVVSLLSLRWTAHVPWSGGTVNSRLHHFSRSDEWVGLRHQHPLRSLLTREILKLYKPSPSGFYTLFLLTSLKFENLSPRRNSWSSFEGQLKSKLSSNCPAILSNYFVVCC